MAEKRHLFRGEYLTLKELSTVYQAHYGNLVRRLRANWSMEQALNLAPKPKRKSHNGISLVTSIGTFSSCREAANATDIKEATIVARKAKGWSDDEAVGAQERPQLYVRKGRSVVCNGRTFLSVAEFSDHYGKKLVKTWKRLNSGWTPEQSVDLVPSPPRYRDQKGAVRDHFWINKQTLEDGSILPATEIGSYRLYGVRDRKSGREYIGITTGDLKSRLRGHWRMVKVGRHSKLYNAMRKALKDDRKNDFIIEQIRNDARDYKELQEQEVLEIEKRDTQSKGFNTAAGGSIGTSKRITIEGKVFPSRQAAAVHYGVPISQFNLRLSRLGWTPEQAAGLDQDKKYGIRIAVEGNEFPSLLKAAQHYGLHYKMVHSRFKDYGWTLEQSLGIEDPPDKSEELRQNLINTFKGTKWMHNGSQAKQVPPEDIEDKLADGWKFGRKSK